MIRSIQLTEITGDIITFLDPYDIFLLSYDPDKKMTGIRMRNNTYYIVKESPEEIEKAIEEARNRK
jgi:uncharacterized protein YlzI (FlbEa/FlbD family)